MTIARALQLALLQRRNVVTSYQRDLCRKIMRGWAKCWRQHHGNKEQFDLAELALGNAIAWRDRETWNEENVRGAECQPAAARSGRVMSTPGDAGGEREATTPPASV